MSCDLSRPCRGNCIVPCVDTAAVVVTPASRCGRSNSMRRRVSLVRTSRADRSPELGEIGFVRPLARDQNEIGRAKRADRRKRQLLGITAANTYQGQRQHAAH